MTPTEAAKKLRLSPQQVRYLIRNGSLAAKKLRHPLYKRGHIWDISEENLEKFKEKRRKQG